MKLKKFFLPISLVISKTINTILLSFVYIISFGLTKLIAIIFNKKFLEYEISKEKKSYWTDIKISKNIYRQF